MAAGTICRQLAPPLASSALRTTTWCRIDGSGECPLIPLLRCISASAPSYTLSAHYLRDQPHIDHWNKFHHPPQPVYTASYRGTKGPLDTFGVSLQQVET